MAFKFSEHSYRELQNVHPDLVRLVERALELTAVDFIVWDGLRTEAEQAEYVRTGVSKTMDSRHLHGLAVDLVPFVGKPRWEWPLCYQVAEAVRQAADELGQPIVWGGMWARLDGTTERPEVLRAKHSGWDGPHFELPRDTYPNNWVELAEIEERAYQEQLAAQTAEEARLKAEEEQRALQEQEEELRRLEAEKLAQEVYAPAPDVTILTDAPDVEVRESGVLVVDDPADSEAPPKAETATVAGVSADASVDNSVDSGGKSRTPPA
jgi:peptidoglycan L-alanyl-D-glutamate endopeptidase CwlK